MTKYTNKLLTLDEFEKVLKDRIGKLETPDKFEKILKDLKGEKYYAEFKKELISMENDVLALSMRNETPISEDHPKVKQYRKAIRMVLEFFIIAVDLEENNPVFKTFKEIDKAEDQMLETLNHSNINKNNPTPQELAFIFGLRNTLCTEILGKYMNEADWESKTWSDITPEDVKWATEIIVKQFELLNDVFGTKGNSSRITRH